MAFDYEAAETDDETARRVAGEMTGTPLAPLSPEEVALREIERETQRELYRQRELQVQDEYLREQAAKAEQEKAEWLAEHRKQEATRQRERQQQFDRELHRRDMLHLRMAAARADAFQRNVESAHRNACVSTAPNALE